MDVALMEPARQPAVAAVPAAREPSHDSGRAPGFCGVGRFTWNPASNTFWLDDGATCLLGGSAAAPRTADELLALIDAGQRFDVVEQVRSAHSAGHELDVMVWLTTPAGTRRLVWLRGSGTAPSGAEPLHGYLIDMTDHAHGLGDRRHDPGPVAPSALGRFSWDQANETVHLSREAAQMLGLDDADGPLPRQQAARFIDPRDVANALRTLEEAQLGDVLRFELQVTLDHGGHTLRADGVVSEGDHGGVALTGTIEDLTAKAVADQAVVNVSRALRTLSSGSRVLTAATDEQELLSSMCATVVAEGGYAFSWYGRAEHDADFTVRPVAWAGNEDGYLSGMRFSWGEGEFAQGPTGQSIRTGRVRYAHMIETHPSFDPWRAAALQRGYRASISLPIRVAGAVDGALMVYAAEPTAFDPIEVSLLDDLAGNLGYGLSRLRDTEALLTAQRTVAADRERLRASEELYRLVTEDVTDAVVRFADDGAVMWVSPSFEALTGFPPGDLVGRNVGEFLPPEDSEDVRIELGKLSGGHPLTGRRIRILRRDQSWRWVTARARPFVHGDGTADGFVGVLRDVQAEVEAEERLEHELGHDRLTGLANRPLALARIARALADLRGSDDVVALLCVGIDGLRQVNQALSYAAGDRVLTAVARQVVAVAGDPDVVARIAGDEFAVVIPHLTDGADAAMVADALRRAARGPVGEGGRAITPSVSVGIAIADRAGEPEELLRHASLALRQAKSAGRDRYEFVDADLAAEAQRRLVMESELRDALDRGQIVPWYQPVVDLAHGELVGYEALARWVRPGGEVLPPGEFLAAAERGRLVAELDHSILRQVLAAVSGLPQELYVAVNVSAVTLSDPDYADTVIDAVRDSGADPHRLRLEVTETALLRSTTEAGSAMRRIAGTGATWFLDDFGTGYSSLWHLRDLPISGLKLDRLFTARIEPRDDTDLRLAKGLVGLAHGLGLQTVAEGVETPMQATILRDQGWHEAQGWLFGRPGPLGSDS